MTHLSFPSANSMSKIFGVGEVEKCKLTWKCHRRGMHQAHILSIFTLLQCTKEHCILFLNDIAFWWGWPPVFVTDGSSLLTLVSVIFPFKSSRHYPPSHFFYLLQKGKGGGWISSFFHLFFYIIRDRWWIVCFFSVHFLLTEIFFFLHEAFNMSNGGRNER